MLFYMYVYAVFNKKKKTADLVVIFVGEKISKITAQ